ncbi:MAG TPA: tetratricopeptide repeat protein [Pirellulales bacterium]|nr:tetratricopeptide repeat protein [Pirellulales bacterium]
MSQLGQPEEGGAEYERALEIQTKLTSQFPAVHQYQVDFGGNCCNYGIVIRDGGKPSESLAWFDKAIETLQRVFEKEARDTLARDYLVASYQSRAATYDRLERFAEAIDDCDKAIELTSAAQGRRLRVSRAFSRLNAGQVAEAVAEVAALAAREAGGPGTPDWTAHD